MGCSACDVGGDWNDLLLDLLTASCSLLLLWSPPGADKLLQFFPLVFTQELQCFLAQILTMLPKAAPSGSFSDSIKFLLSASKISQIPSKVLDHPSSFGAFSFKNLSNMNIPNKDTSGELLGGVFFTPQPCNHGII